LKTKTKNASGYANWITVVQDRVEATQHFHSLLLLLLPLPPPLLLPLESFA